MISQSDGKIGAREFFAVVLFSIGTKFTDSTSTFVFRETGCSAWMMPLISFGIIMLPLGALLYLLKKNKNLGLVEVIYKQTGKYVGFLLSLIVFIITFIATISGSRAYVEIVRTLFYPKTSTFVLYLLLVAACFLLAKQGFETIGRTGWFVFPITLVSIISLFLMVTREIEVSSIYPLWGNGVKPLINSTFKYGSILGDIIVLTAVFPLVRSYKDFKRSSIYGLAVSTVAISLSLMVFVTIFGYPAVKYILFPFQQVSTMVRLGRFLKNFESLYFGFWVVVSVVRFSIYLYMTAFVFSRMVKIREFEPLLLPFAALTFILGMIPKNIIGSGFILRAEFLLQNAFPVFVGLPLVLWTVSKIRGGKTGEQ